MVMYHTSIRTLSFCTRPCRTQRIQRTIEKTDLSKIDFTFDAEIHRRVRLPVLIEIVSVNFSVTRGIFERNTFPEQKAE